LGNWKKKGKEGARPLYSGQNSRIVEEEVKRTVHLPCCGRRGMIGRIVEKEGNCWRLLIMTYGGRERKKGGVPDRFALIGI